MGQHHHVFQRLNSPRDDTYGVGTREADGVAGRLGAGAADDVDLRALLVELGARVVAGAVQGDHLCANYAYIGLVHIYLVEFKELRGGESSESSSVWRPSRLGQQVIKYVLERYVSRGFSVLGFVPRREPGEILEIWPCRLERERVVFLRTEDTGRGRCTGGCGWSGGPCR